MRLLHPASLLEFQRWTPGLEHRLGAELERTP
jgi:hypothetical protein